VSQRRVCALCGDAKLKQLFDKDGYRICRCGSCGLLQVGTVLGRNDLEEIYGEEYFSSDVFHDYLGQRRVRVESGTTAAATLARLVPRGRLLDVGCAAGFFLEAAARHYDVTGIELSPFASEYARSELGLRVLTGDVTDGELEGEKFDVVTLWNTIEHMANPLGALRAIAQLARPGAVLVISTGDASGPLARRDLLNWNLMSPPYHLSFFSPETIDLLLAKTGFLLRRIVYDGVVATAGPLASAPGRQLAAVAGFGNVMTVYALRTTAASTTTSRIRRLAARHRPLRFVVDPTSV
jgi:SAM-dependent methyltransferase